VKKNRFDKFISWTEKNANEGKSFRWWVYSLKVLKLNELNNAKQMISVCLLDQLSRHSYSCICDLHNWEICKAL